MERAELAALADRMLLAARAVASPHHSLIFIPGPEGGYGHAIDGLEGFTRTFLMAGFRIAGEEGNDPLHLADWYAEGIAAGTDPDSPERWTRLTEHAQAKVEAAALALILDLTRPWLWDRLPPEVQSHVIDYLAPAVGDDTYPQTNWVWFRLLVQTFLRSVGGPFSEEEMRTDLATHDRFVRSGGWLADGSERSFDHYVGWTLHLYPTLWARMQGVDDLAAGRTAGDRARLDRYLQDAVRLLGADGSPLAQGRSLIYKFAAAAPFWAGAIARVPSVRPGLLRRAATGVVEHFVSHGALGDDDLLTLGWYGPWPALAQSYSGPGSPYWASLGMLGLVLPADDEVWTAPVEKLPVEQNDQLFAIESPAWVASTTQADGLVRITNHGTDHDLPGSTSADSPLYARYAYSTATFPLLDQASWENPLDQSVTLIDASRRASHRSGMVPGPVEVRDGVGIATSSVQAHWVDAVPDAHRHGSGLTGRSTPAGRMTVVSLVRGPWEVRAVRIDAVDAAATALRFGGWPLAGPDAILVDTPQPAVASAGLASRLVALTGPATSGIDVRDGASPLASRTWTPWLSFEPVVGSWTAVLLELIAHDRSGDAPKAAAVELTARGRAVKAHVTWPDGLVTDTTVQTGHPDRPLDDPSHRLTTESVVLEEKQ